MTLYRTPIEKGLKGIALHIGFTLVKLVHKVIHHIDQRG